MKKYFSSIQSMAALLLALTTILVTACGNPAGGGSTADLTFRAPTVEDAPAFPPESAPLSDETQVQAVLDEIKASGVIEQFFGDIREVHESHQPDVEVPERVNYEFYDKEGSHTRVSYKNAYNSGGSTFLPDDLYGSGELSELTASDFVKESGQANAKNTIVSKITNDTVTLATGGYCIGTKSERTDIKIVTGGTLEEAIINLSDKIEMEQGMAMTITTSHGAVKLIYSVKSSLENYAKNVVVEELESRVNRNFNRTGIFRMYGEGNKVLCRETDLVGSWGDIAWLWGE